MNQNPRRQPVQPWIPPQKAAVRTVYVERPAGDGSKALRAGWVLNGVALVITIGIVVVVALYADQQAKNGAETGVGVAAALGGVVLIQTLGWLMAAAIMTLIIVAMAQGSAIRGLILFAGSIMNAVLCAAGLTAGPMLAAGWAQSRRLPHSAAQPVPVEPVPLPVQMQDVPDIESSSRRADLVRRAEAGAKIAHPETRTGLRRTLLEESTHGLTDPDAAQVRNEVNRLFDAAEAKWKARGLR
jgi:hypothetical protein